MTKMEEYKKCGAKAELHEKERRLITIGEYIQLTAPEVFVKLRAIAAMVKTRDVTELVLAAADVVGIGKYYHRIMTERPHPGRGGLLPGEEAVV